MKVSMTKDEIKAMLEERLLTSSGVKYLYLVVENYVANSVLIPLIKPVRVKRVKVLKETKLSYIIGNRGHRVNKRTLRCPNSLKGGFFQFFEDLDSLAEYLAFKNEHLEV